MRLLKCGTHLKNDGKGCESCWFAIEMNIWRQFCDCGKPAVGYVVKPPSPATFHCDEHYPAAASTVVA